MSSFQIDGRATIEVCGGGRSFEDDDHASILRLAHLLRVGEAPNELDKVKIANLAKKGYAATAPALRLMVPYLTREQMIALGDILSKAFRNDIGWDIFADYVVGFAKGFAKEIPDFVPETDRVHYSYEISPHYAVMYGLSDRGKLRYPTPEEAKVMCTIVWDNI